jgi:hypothetical protein
VFFFDGEGIQRSLPIGWTNASDVDLFVVVAGGRCPFRVTDLLELAVLLDGPASRTVEGVGFGWEEVSVAVHGHGDR